VASAAAQAGDRRRRSNRTVPVASFGHNKEREAFTVVSWFVGISAWSLWRCCLPSREVAITGQSFLGRRNSSLVVTGNPVLTRGLLLLRPPTLLQEFEAKYVEKKTAYDNIIATFEARTAALETEVSALKVGRRVDWPLGRLLRSSRLRPSSPPVLASCPPPPLTLWLG
jgi:hypothetical protein